MSALCVAALAALSLLCPLAARAQQPPAPAAAPPLEIARRVVTIIGADEASHALEVLERVELRNTSDAPFVPSTSGGMGPMGILRFALPRGAFDLTPDERLASADIIPVDRGFGSLLTLPPGVTDATFAYRVPYAGRQFELSAGVVYPTDSLLLLVPEGLSVESSDLRPRETVAIGRQRYQVLAAENLAAGARPAATLGNLPFTPRPWLLEEPVQRAIAAALAAGSIVAVWWYAWRRARTLAAAESRA